jgi:hypothetical protein
MSLKYPSGPCTGTSLNGARCRQTDVYENGRCQHHGGAGMLVRDLIFLDRAHAKLRLILRRAAVRGIRGAQGHLVKLLDQYKAYAESSKA